MTAAANIAYVWMTWVNYRWFHFFEIVRWVHLILVISDIVIWQSIKVILFYFIIIHEEIILFHVIVLFLKTTLWPILLTFQTIFWKFIFLLYNPLFWKQVRSNCWIQCFFILWTWSISSDSSSIYIPLWFLCISAKLTASWFADLIIFVQIYWIAIVRTLRQSFCVRKSYSLTIVLLCLQIQVSLSCLWCLSRIAFVNLSFHISTTYLWSHTVFRLFHMILL